MMDLLELTEGFLDLVDDGVSNTRPVCSGDYKANNRCRNDGDSGVLDHCLAALSIAKVDPGLLETNLKAEQCVVVHDDLHR